MTTRGDGARVLYSDPDEATRCAVTEWLEAADYRVVAVADTLDALARVVEGRFDVVILRAQSPRVDGYRGCALIKRHPACGRTPVIIVVADPGPYETAEARFAGAESCLSLPLSESGLLAAVCQASQDTPLLVHAQREMTPASERMGADVRES